MCLWIQSINFVRNFSFIITQSRQYLQKNNLWNQLEKAKGSYWTSEWRGKAMIGPGFDKNVFYRSEVLTDEIPKNTPKHREEVQMWFKHKKIQGFYDVLQVSSYF